MLSEMAVCGNELYRVAQEAVTHSVRHGQATRVDIEGRILNRRFLLDIADNGRGMSMTEPVGRSMGIRIMQYRARHLGGNQGSATLISARWR